MKCPKCEEDLGINALCTNPSCTFFTKSIIDNRNTNTCNTDNTTNANINYNNTDNTSNFNCNKTQFSDDNSKQNNCFSNDSIKISDKEFLNFVGYNNNEYYLDKFTIFNSNNNFISWNCSAFFLTGYWLLYRKMYICGTLLLLLNLYILNLDINFILSLIIHLIMSILVGLYGNNMYMRSAKRKIKKIKESFSNIDDESYLRKIRLNGGTNSLAPSLYALILLFFLIMSGFIYALDTLYKPVQNYPSKEFDNFYNNLYDGKLNNAPYDEYYHNTFDNPNSSDSSDVPDNSESVDEFTNINNDLDLINSPLRSY